MNNDTKRLELKVRSLLEKLIQREDEIANLRVELTLASESLGAAETELSELKNAQAQEQESSNNTD